jgi:phospholipid/cholesterol/gamma-HCH transport system ATP-binding protein
MDIIDPAQALTEPTSQASLMQAIHLSVQAGGVLRLSGLTFDVHPGEVLAIVGASGSGKSTLLRHLMGLERPVSGQVLFRGQGLHDGDAHTQALRRRRLGVMFQNGALWSSLSVGENLALPMRLLERRSPAECEQRARQKLALVGLDGAYHTLPDALSGGMRKRAALARALALDPELLLLDEPGSGLDPVSAARLDDLIRHLCHDLGTAIVKVTHDIPSVFAVADRMLFLDENERTMTALGHPLDLLHHGPAPVRAFLQQGHPA